MNRLLIRRSSAARAGMRRSVIGAALMMIGSIAFAAPPAPTSASTSIPALTLAQAIAATLEHNPELRSSRFALQAADARIAQADVAPAPELSLQVENIGGSDRFNDAAAAETTLLLSQVLELGDKRGARRNTAQAGYSTLSIAEEARRLDVLAEVSRRFVQVAVDQQRSRLTQRATTLAQRTLQAVDARVRAAKSPDVELHRARIALLRAQMDEEHAEHELLAARTKLAAMWGDEKPDFAAVTADLFALPAPGDFDALVARLKTNPDFTRFAHEQRLRDAELRLAKTRRVPDVQLGAGIRQLRETDDHAFVVSLSVPLFTASRSNGAIAEASARRGQVAVDERAAFLRAQAQLFALHQELRHSIAEAEMLREKILPQSQAILEQTEYAYRRGRYSYLDWIAAQRELLDAERNLIEASANAHRFLIEIERLTGEDFGARGDPAGQLEKREQP